MCIEGTRLHTGMERRLALLFKGHTRFSHHAVSHSSVPWLLRTLILKTAIFALLNPILDASHTRNLNLSPPNSRCFPGTRKKVLKKIRTWVNCSLIFKNPHVMWIYGYAGCGKSAIAQAICKHFADQGRLVAAFFFFRGAGDRSNISRFATTVASQVAAAIPATEPLIQAAIEANPGLLSTTTASLSEQFEQLVYQPINSVKWDRLAASFRHGPYLIALDGVDECGDRDEVAEFIKHSIAFFEKEPSIPLRFLITSRVESHIHKLLHSSSQVKLLNLVEHTSDADIAAALDVVIEEEKRGRIVACDPSWPSPEDKAKLVKHIAGSYIFMTTIIRLLFDPNLNDGLTPMARLPLVLSQRPDFDSLYREILTPWQHLHHFRGIISTIALAMEPLSIAEVAELLEISTADVVTVLVNLHAIMQVPGDDHSPVALWHTSLRDFICSEERSGPIHAPPAHHQRLAYRCITLSAPSSPLAGSHISKYSRCFALDHWVSFMRVMDENGDSFHGEMKCFITHLRMTFPQHYPSVVFTYFKVPSQAPSMSIYLLSFIQF